MRIHIRFSLAALSMLLAAVTVASAQDTPQSQSQTGPDSQTANGQPQAGAKTVAPKQDDWGRYVVSATAGGINTVDGDVTFKRGQDDWKPVVVGDQLRSGDQIKSGADGQAEVLLTPGSYLRLSSNTEIRMDSTSLDDLRLTVSSGSAIIEAAAFDKNGRTLATLSMPKGSFAISHRGVYRFNVNADGSETVEVEKGKLAVNGTEIGEGKTATIEGPGGSPAVHSLSKSSPDGFDGWSEQRAKSLVDANANLQSPTPLSPGLASGGPYAASYNPWLPGFYSFYNAYYATPPLWGGGCAGSWYFNPFFGGYTYLPGFYDLDFFGNSYPCFGAFSGYGFRYPILGYYRRRGQHLARLPLGTIVSRRDGREPGVRLASAGRSGGRFGGSFHSGSGSASSGHSVSSSSGGAGGHSSSGGGGGGGHR